MKTQMANKMSLPFNIVNAAMDDIPALTDLLDTLFAIEVDFSADRTKQIRGLQMIIENPQHAIIKVARNSENKVIGMVSAQLVISTAQGSYSAWVEDMVIAEEYRGIGLGRKLLDAAIHWAKEKGATRAQLLVDIENEPALGYYQHIGWQSTQLQARKIFF
jgi:GNAT superfamily N-acetyltransferase